MPTWAQILVAVSVAVIGSNGLWAFMQSRRDKKDAKTRMILGLGHDRIIYLCIRYIERGWISNDEYEDLVKYLYGPYKEMGGNGTAEKLMNEVKKLPIHRISYQQQARRNQTGNGTP
jgi:hypothetical protein